MNENGSVNKVMLAGIISHRPQWQLGDDGNAVLCFTLITPETFLQKGQQVEHTEEHSIKIFGDKQEPDLRQGQWVHIEGKIKTTTFTDKQAIKRYKTEVVANKVTLLGMDG